MSRGRSLVTAFARLGFAFTVAALVSACAATPQTRGIEREPPADLPPAAELSSVPFLPQDDYQCGPAALATALRHAGFDANPEALVDEVYVPAKRGSLRPEMRAAARARGAVVYPLEGSLEALLREIAGGDPVLVMQNLGLDWWPRWHYAVVVGYDMGRDTVVLRSGRTKRRVTQMRTFERTWQRADRWAQVIVAPDDPPVSADPVTWLESVRELERGGSREAAITGYRAATQRWPERPAAWLALGNAQFEQGDHAAARESFGEAVSLAPESGDGWNNLAYALARTGCGESAVEAARCAVRVAPENPEYNATLDELTSRARAQGLGQDCAIPACPVAASQGG